MNKNHLSAHVGQYALLKNTDNKVLLLERARSKTWSLPGGRLNDDEECDLALLRELKEELNLDCTNPKPFGVNILKDSYQTKYCVYFTLDYSSLSTLKISSEHSNFGWFDLEEIKSLNVEDEKIRKIVLDFLITN